MPDLQNGFHRCRIAFEQIEVFDKLEKHDIWYPDCTAEGKITYLRERQLMDFFTKESAEDMLAYRRSKEQEIKVGKFLTKCDLYDFDTTHSLQAYIAPPKIITLPGKYISWAYDVAHNAPNCGSLSSSCMRHASMAPYFKLYREYNKGTEPQEIFEEIENHFDKPTSKVSQFRNRPDLYQKSQKLLPALSEQGLKKEIGLVNKLLPNGFHVELNENLVDENGKPARIIYSISDYWIIFKDGEEVEVAA